MEQKRNISARKIVQASVTILVTGACIIAMLSAARTQDVKKLQGFDIAIKNDKYAFVDKEDIKRLLTAGNADVSHMSIGKLDAHKLEGIVNANPWVAGSQVYVGNDKVVHVNVTQRIPVARLFDQTGNSYYLDNALKAMPLSDKYTHYTTVVTNVPFLQDDSLGNSLKAQIVAVVRKIEKDSFWSAQVSQIMLTDDRTFELVPVLGNQRILLGDTSMLNDKFDNLFAFYQKVLNRIGWDKYEILDVRYQGQVVASPAIAWKVPFDKALSNMNWVKSIIGTDVPDGAMKVPVASMVSAPATAAATTAPVTATPQPAPAKVEVKLPVAAKAVVTAPVVKKVVEQKNKPKPVVAAKPKIGPPSPAQQKKIVPAAKKIEVKKPASKHEDKKAQHKTNNTKEKKDTKQKEEPKPKYLYQAH